MIATTVASEFYFLSVLGRVAILANIFEVINVDKRAAVYVLHFDPANLGTSPGSAVPESLELDA